MNRVLSYITSLLLLLSGCSSDPLTVASYNRNGADCELPDNGLPVVEINTADGKGITDKLTWRDATIRVHGGGLFDDMAADIQLKGRGNSTFHFPKKAFNISFASKQKMLGMSKSKKWIFLANYRDHTLMRNDVTFHIGTLADNLEWTPHGEFVDVVFNGNYVGNYYVCEKINVNKNHVDIDEMDENDTIGVNLTGGYLLDIDKYYDEDVKFRTTQMNLPVEVLSPDADVCRPEQISYITDYVNTIETLLLTGDYKRLYDEYIDLPSFIDYYLVQTVSGNNDISAPHSVYMYKKRNGKLYAGPLWDFDFSTYFHENKTPHVTTLWYKQLFKDPYFVDQVRQRWSELRGRIEADVFPYIENKRQYIFRSALANFQAFDFPFSVNNFKAADAGYIISVDKMEEVLRKRLQYIDKILNDR